MTIEFAQYRYRRETDLILEGLIGIAHAFSTIRILYIPGLSYNTVNSGCQVFGDGDPVRYIVALQLFTNVTEIYIGPAAKELLCLLGKDTHDDGADTVPLPALTAVVVDIREIRGMPREHIDDVSRDEPELYEDAYEGHIGKDWFAALSCMLSKRDARGRRVRRLVLRGQLCHLAIVDEEIGSCVLEDIALDNLASSTDEIVDERTSCEHTVVV